MLKNYNVGYVQNHNVGYGILLEENCMLQNIK